MLDDALRLAITTLASNGPLDARYWNGLRGDWEGYRECHIGPIYY
jgi:mRNA-degrading endonuclease YafQ of YafQ-DinJ toxin-antitoxin module